MDNDQTSIGIVFDIMRENNQRLRAQIDELLPWAIIGATAGRTDSTWDAAVAMMERINSGEFDGVQK